MISVIVATCFVVFIGLGNFLCSIMQPRYAIHLDDDAFRLHGLSNDYAPFNIQNVGGNLVVTFAHREEGSKDEDHGAGLGFAGVFDRRGRLLLRLEHGPWFNAPWGVALAPGDFGQFSHRLLIGNFGDGTVNAFNLMTGKHEGTMLDDTSGKAYPVPTPDCHQTIDPSLTTQLTGILQGVVDRGTGTRVHDYFQGPAAGKTGTNDSRKRWLAR